MFTASFTILNLFIALVGWVIRFLDKIEKGNKKKKPNLNDIKKTFKENWLVFAIQFLSIIVLLYLGPIIVKTGFGLCVQEGSHFYNLYAFFVGYFNYAIIRGCTNWFSSKTWFVKDK